METSAASSSQEQPVWVKLSIVQQLASSSQHSSYNSSSRAVTIATNSNRSGNGWGWLFGRASIQEHANVSASASIESRPIFNPEEESSTIVKSSPLFGQVKLRKTPRSSMRKQIINGSYGSSNSNSNSNSNSKNSAHSSIRNQNYQQPMTILIQDEWNTTFNGMKIDLSAQQVDKFVVLANVHHSTIDVDNISSSSSNHTCTPSNLIELTHLHEPSLIKSLKDRYEQDKVYTFCGKILLALNPFRQMQELYSKATMKQYWIQDGGSAGDNDAKANHQEPHVYAVAHEAFSAMIRAFDDSRTMRHQNSNVRSNKNNNNHELEIMPIDQSILVSGESGAGKTVTTKFVMQYLASLSERSNQKAINGTNGSSRSMEQQVLQSNPILESFGNARTIRNDNSSRFGKFIEIQFHKNGCLMGASIHTYLLEKVRLIRQTEGERNYHIFYEMMSGLDMKEKREFGLNGLKISDFRIMACSGTMDRRDGVKDKDTYRALCHAMQTVGFSSLEQQEILQVTSGLLHMSNIDFRETTSDSVVIDDKNPSLRHVLKNFGVDLTSLSNSLCTCAITVGNEILTKNLTLDKVKMAMDALMKATYGALFEYIVNRVNNSITVGGDQNGDGDIQHQTHQDYAFIKILDIFGFESFQKNSFEQLCINYCNEALQQQFNRFIFKLEQQEYERENIAWSFISFPDNQDVLDLIEKKHTGIFSILDEQCKLARCTDSSFSLAMNEKCSDHSRFGASRTQKARGFFAVNHYAGIVEYDTSSFLDKNKDELPKEATDFLFSSSIKTVSQLGTILSNKNGNGKAGNKNSSLSRASVGSQFTAQLKELRGRIDLTSPHYIRCIKPNDELIPHNFIPGIVADQLNCAGVLEAVRVSRVGYPQRYTKHLFVRRYWILSIDVIENAKTRGRDLCEELVEHLVPQIWAKQQGITNSDDLSPTRRSPLFDLVSVGLQLGRTKVFLRHHAFNALESLRMQKQRGSATKIQSVARMFLCRERFRRICGATLRLQCCLRSFLARKELQCLNEYQKAVIIQSVWRGYTDYFVYSRILYLSSWCQRFHRGNVARVRVNDLLLEKRVTNIQSWWRMGILRARYMSRRLAAFNVQQLFRAKQARRILRQLKLEAKDVSQITIERDRLKDALMTLKAREESWKKSLGPLNSMNSNNEEIKRLIDESKRKDEKIALLEAVPATFTQKSPNSSTDQYNVSSTMSTNSVSLLREKDSELARFRYELEQKDKQIFELKGKITELQSIINFKGDCLKTPRNTGLIAGSDPLCGPTNLLDNEIKLKTPNTRSTVCLDELNDSYSRDSTVIRPKALHFDTPIHTAIRAADGDALSVAVTNCDDVASDINRGGRDGKSPLHLAVLNSNIASATFLLKNHSVANTQDNDGNTPLHYAESPEMVKILLDVGKANPNIPNEAGITAMHVAVRRRDAESVNYLLEHRANVNVADYEKWLTPLHLIAQSSNFECSTQDLHAHTIEIAEALFNLHAPNSIEVDCQDKDGNTPLHHASVLGSRHVGDLISLMLKNKANPNIQNERGQSPLHLVLHNINLSKFDFYNDLIQLLIYHGAGTDIPSLSGCTPLHLVLYHQDQKNAILLIENGAQLHHPWDKPTRWQAHWTEYCTGSEVYSLEMVDDDDLRHSLISSIKSKQNAAPLRSNCMFCKKKVGTFSRPKNCHHCGSLVCSACSPNTLDRRYFPSYCDLDEDEGRVCLLCEPILIARKRDENIMGREVYAIHSKLEDVSFLDMETTQLGDGSIPQLQIDM